jgi:hypothetical protein
MTSLEHEIIEKFQQLDKDAQQRVRALIDRELETTDKAAFDYDAWFAEVEAAQISLRPDASGRTPSASDLVNEVREERDADILRSIGLGDSAGNGTA